jgi:hypothetical protein
MHRGVDSGREVRVSGSFGPFIEVRGSEHLQATPLFLVTNNLAGDPMLPVCTVHLSSNVYFLILSEVESCSYSKPCGGLLELVRFRESSQCKIYVIILRNKYINIFCQKSLPMYINIFISSNDSEQYKTRTKR